MHRDAGARNHGRSVPVRAHAACTRVYCRRHVLKRKTPPRDRRTPTTAERAWEIDQAAVDLVEQ